jgi:hypothetical protein
VTGVSSLEQASGAGSLRSKKEGIMQRKFTVSGTIGLVVLVAALLAGTALASGTTPQGLEADGLRLQAVAQAYGQTEGSTSLGLKADGLRLQGIAQAYGQTEGSTPQGHEADGLRLLWIARAYQDRPAASYYTPEALRAQGLRWNAVARSYDGRSVSTVSSVSNGFDWTDAGIGAAGGLGFAAFGVAAVVFARHLRRAKLAL